MACPKRSHMSASVPFPESAVASAASYQQTAWTMVRPAPEVLSPLAGSIVLLECNPR